MVDNLGKRLSNWFYWFRIFALLFVVSLFFIFKIDLFILLAIFFALELIGSLFIFVKYKYLVGYAMYSGEYAHKADFKGFLIDSSMNIIGIIVAIVLYFVY